jgi:NTP pyrophosphatase (non-canonical NTP hydrolase)
VNVGEKLMLIVSEVAEGMEGHRKNLMDDKLTDRRMLEVELADAVIRIADLAGGLGLDLGGAIAEKLAFNQKRPDHKPENRVKEGGKSY